MDIGNMQKNNLLKIGHVVTEISSLTDRQTDTQTHRKTEPQTNTGLLITNHNTSQPLPRTK